MRLVLELLCCALIGVAVAGVFWLAVVLDDAELKAGSKSPVSGFCPHD